MEKNWRIKEEEKEVEKLKSKSEKLVQTASMEQQQSAAIQEIKQPVLKPEITFDDFAKIDLKTATITAAEKVEKADKLLKLEVDLGFEKRTIVSGIALHFAPDAIIGKQVLVVTNLAPRKMRGIESNGMILMAEDADGKLQFVTPAENVNNGSNVS